MKTILISVVSSVALGTALFATQAWAESPGPYDAGTVDGAGSGKVVSENAAPNQMTADNGYWGANRGDWTAGQGYGSPGNTGPGPYSDTGAGGPGTGKTVADNGYGGPAMADDAGYRPGPGYGESAQGYGSANNTGPGPYSDTGAGGPGTGKVVADGGYGYGGPAMADNAGYRPSYGESDQGYGSLNNTGPGPYSDTGAGGPGTGKVVADAGDGGYYGGPAAPGERVAYTTGYWRAGPSNGDVGNSGPGPYSAGGVGGPGTGKVVAIH